MKTSINNILQTQESYNNLINVNKQAFQALVNAEESLVNLSQYFEFLDEIFFIIKENLTRTLETMNGNASCAQLEYIANTVIHEMVYKIINDLVSRYLKRDFFHGQGICFHPAYTLNNAFMILLINNIDIVLKYLKKLKINLLQKRDEIYQGDANKDYQMITASIESIELANSDLFYRLLKEKMKILTEYLKFTIKQFFDDFKSINFIQSEQNLSDYEKNVNFSATFIQRMNIYLKQWSVQLSKDNYALFLAMLVDTISDTFYNIILNKKYNQIGAILVDKEIRSILQFFSNIAQTNLSQQTQKLQLLCEILILESQKDMEEFYTVGAGVFTMDQIKEIIKLRSDFKTG